MTNSRRCPFVLSALTAACFVLAGATIAARAQGTPGTASVQEAAQCPDCKARLDSGGWCESCKVGHAKGLKTKCKSCLAAIQKDGWCEGCGVGYADGKKTTCKSCWAAMKSDKGGWCEGCKVGHARGLTTKCKSCFAAIQENGWCEGCGVGYAEGKKTSCKSCYAAMTSATGGWCEGCKVGHAKGLETKCKSCFAAIQNDGTCESCHVRFHKGRSFKTLTLHIEGLGVADAPRKVREILAEYAADRTLTIDASTGVVQTEIETTKGTSVTDVLAALKKSGFSAREAQMKR